MAPSDNLSMRSNDHGHTTASDIDALRARLLAGGVIPAHPLALTSERRFDERHQRALTRYYIDAGASALAVGVHTTQFEIHSPGVGLYKPVLELAAQTAAAWCTTTPPLLIAGVIGRTRQAVHEAGIAAQYGYDLALVSLGALADADDAQLVAHCTAVADVLPVVGFYLQPAVGGRVLTESFWRRFFEIPAVVAVKVAPFDRYATLDVVRALAASGRAREIALYTGNDDAIVHDLLGSYRTGHTDELHFVGGLLGHWSYGTHAAVDLLARIRDERAQPGTHAAELYRLATDVTELNAAVFDPHNRFAGCLSGIQHMLLLDGLVASDLCLGYTERLSPGQADAIVSARARHPHLLDTDFIATHRERWLVP
jgi:dihydrodipicolinate synthase/N-acetylneuraminate lyase